MTNDEPSRRELQCGHGGEAVENHHTSSPSLGPGPGFNAATAVKPWRTMLSVNRVEASAALQCGHGGEAVENRTSPRRSRRRCGPRFNAATAVKPWRTLELKDKVPPGVDALQCGHGGEAVENIAGFKKQFIKNLELQCGHGGEAVENACQLERSNRYEKASMRPRR